jgi:hypothetical protein
MPRCYLGYIHEHFGSGRRHAKQSPLEKSTDNYNGSTSQLPSILKNRTAGAPAVFHRSWRWAVCTDSVYATGNAITIPAKSGSSL